MEPPKYKLGDLVLYEHLFSKIEYGIITLVYDEPDDDGMWWYMMITVGEKTSNNTPECDIKQSMQEFDAILNTLCT